MFLVGEAAELGEYCQWLTKDEIKEQELDSAVSSEIADVIKNALYLINVVPLTTNLEMLLIEKLILDESEYPVEQFEGKSRFHVVKKERSKKKRTPIPENKLSPLPSIADVQRNAMEFVKARKWERFYGPASLALSIAVKSGEVATCYQRRPKPIESPYDRMMWALADILLNAMRLCWLFDINNIYEIVLKKLDDDERRFKKHAIEKEITDKLAKAAESKGISLEELANTWLRENSFEMGQE